MSQFDPKCPICGGSTVYVAKGKKQKYICKNVECSTELVKEGDFIFMDTTQNKENSTWKSYRYKRLTFDELSTIAEGGRVTDKEHMDAREGLGEVADRKIFKSKEKEFPQKSGFICPFSWIEVTVPAGCLASMFGGRDKLAWEAQPCMGQRCQLWDSEVGDCGLITKNS